MEPQIRGVDASFIDLTTIVGSIVAANVLVLGFLLAWTLADHKESERLPGEVASSIETVANECLITYKNKRGSDALDALAHMSDCSTDLWRWFHKEERSKNLLARVSGMNEYLLTFESLTQPNFIVRLKQEQNNIGRMTLRIDAIRDTPFLSVGYSGPTSEPLRSSPACCSPTSNRCTRRCSTLGP